MLVSNLCSMASPVNRTYLRQTRDAAEMLGKLIRLGRKERKMTEEDLSGRAGISRRTLQKIERGDLKCEIGLVFEVERNVSEGGSVEAVVCQILVPWANVRHVIVMEERV